MKRLLASAAGILLAATFFAGSAGADELRGRLALSARVGVTLPTDSEKLNQVGERVVVASDAGLVVGGGILYGLDDNVAFELDISRTAWHTSAWGTAEVKDLSVGAQYRFPQRSRMIPYGAAGVDVLINDLDHPSVSAVDTVFGAHLAGGIDYVVSRQFVLNAEIRGIEAFSADVKKFDGTKGGSFDPTSLSFTIGARFFFN